MKKELFNELLESVREAGAISRGETAAARVSETVMRDVELEHTSARMLELQIAEAKKFREQFEASLTMPIDAGAQILARARALRKELEDNCTQVEQTIDE